MHRLFKLSLTLMAESRLLSSFSPGAEIFAAVSADGYLKLWDVASGNLRTAPPADLKDPITCIEWNDHGLDVGTKQKKKKKAGQADFRDSELLLGTQNGNVYILNTRSNAILKMNGSHTGRVTDGAWGAKEFLYTCSEDKYICEWRVADRTLSKKWLGDSRGVTSLCLGALLADGATQTLISAGSKIRVWDLSSYQEIKNITGHEYHVSALKLSPLSGHVLSVTFGQPDDTLLQLWSLDADGKGKKATASFMPSATPVVLNVSPSLGGETWRVLIVNSSGELQLFQYAGEKEKKPVAPIATIKMATGDVPSAPVPIINAIFSSGRAGSHVILVRGALAAPVFESVMYVNEETSAPLNLELVREASKSFLLSSSKASATSNNSNDDNVTILGAANATRLGKPKRSKGETEDLSIADKLKSLNVATGTDNDSAGAPIAAPRLPGSGVPQAGSLAHMLVQAIHSNDNALIEECLSNTHEGVVRSTVTRLPPVVVGKFLICIVSKLEAKPNRGVMLLVWIRAILLIHTSYLMTVPDLASMLSGLYSLVDARLSVFPRLLKLSGRLDLMLSQIALRAQGSSNVDVESLQVPAMTYTEDSDNDGSNTDALNMSSDEDGEDNEAGEDYHGSDEDMEGDDVDEDDEGGDEDDDSD